LIFVKWFIINTIHYKLNKSEFANLAIGLLEKCYKEDDQLTHQLLTYDLINWSHWTCLSLAVSSNLKEFLSHTVCQTLLNNLWMGGMKIRKHIILKVITALIFPPVIFTIQFKSVKELQYMPQTQREHENELEIKEEGSHSENLSNDEKLEKISVKSMDEKLINRNDTFNQVNESTLTGSISIKY